MPAHEVGLAILAPLRELDEVAYLRFASVYRAFESAEDFEAEIAALRLERAAGEPADRAPRPPYPRRANPQTARRVVGKRRVGHTTSAAPAAQHSTQQAPHQSRRLTTTSQGRRSRHDGDRQRRSTHRRPQGPGKGLKIERVFSTEGVHPYDELTWERRDVVQTNWKTGETVFEQRGVEFPDTWSVNASTIVTTKYFRGAVGTDAREWSLKQLIDRVVKTYRKGGEEQRLLRRRRADAELFEHELTWLLVHQYFSFNSPVWFNVGTHSPQQVSACFILVGRRLDGLDPELVQGGGLHLQGRLRRRPEPLPDPLLQGAALLRRHRRRARSPSCAAPTRPRAPSSPAAPPAARPRWSCSTSTTPTSRSSSRPRRARRTRSARCATPASTWTSAARDITSVQYQNANNSVRVTDEFMRAVEEGTEFGLRARSTGEVIETVDARELFRKISEAAWECADPGLQYDDTINDWHTNPETGRITASNPCSEYMSLDNSSCNLASLNLLKFLKDDDTFDAELFAKAVEVIITAMDISICFADFPTESIGETTRDYRQLGIGYANLGALLMAMGLGYDSDGGRSMAATITSLMTGTSYKRSAELAARGRPVRRLRPQRRRPQARDAQAPGRQRRGPHAARRRRPGAQAGHQGVGRTS